MAVSGVGAVFQKKTADSSDGDVFTTISQINQISGPDLSRDVIDVTNLDSTGGYREFIAGFRDGGEVTLNMNFTKTTFDLMKEDFDSDVLNDYRIVLPDVGNTTFSFSGLVTGIGMAIPMADKITADTKIKISGELTVE